MNLLKFPIFLLFLFLPQFTHAELVRAGHVQLELVPEYLAATPGTTLHVALRVVHDDNWHTYWLHSTTGYAPTVRWELPKGVTAGELIQPLPEVYLDGGIVDYIHSGEVLLPTPIALTSSYRPGPDKQMVVKAHVELLACSDQCVPESADLELVIPVREDALGAETEWARPIRSVVDETATGDGAQWKIAARQEGRTAVISVSGSKTHNPGRFYFFSSDGLIAAKPIQDQKTLTDGTTEITLPFSPNAPQKPEQLAGFLTARNGWGPGEPKAFAINLELNPPSSAPGSGHSATHGPYPLTLLPALGFALLGGLILNLMPCVFPILGLKVMSFIKLAGKRGGAAWGNALAFASGVCVTLTALAAILLLLRAAGTRLGWGFQLQDPRVLFLGIVLFLLFGLNMAGAFEIGLSASGIGVNKEKKLRGELFGSFFSGILAVIVATPCSAPFLGSAVGYAFARPAYELLAVFWAVGIGFSSPYVLFATFPRLLKFLPKPGPWMEKLKKYLSILLFATVAYLFWALLPFTGESFSAVSLVFAILLILLAGYTYGQYASAFDGGTAATGGTFRRARVHRGFMKAKAIGLPLLYLAIAFHLGWPGKQVAKADNGLSQTPVPAYASESDEPRFTAWKPGLAEKLAGEGHIVWVDFTARWCATCQVNKKVVFASQEVRQLFTEHKVIILRADWTGRDESITAELARWNRYAVPFNLLYAPGQKPVEMPTILTPGIVEEELKKAAH